MNESWMLFLNQVAGRPRRAKSIGHNHNGNEHRIPGKLGDTCAVLHVSKFRFHGVTRLPLQAVMLAWQEELLQE